jgi:hypothetical protein
MTHDFTVIIPENFSLTNNVIIESRSLSAINFELNSLHEYHTNFPGY